MVSRYRPFEIPRWRECDSLRRLLAAFDRVLPLRKPSDLSRREVVTKAEYKSQMELYLRWVANHEQEPEEQPPIGIILCASKKQEQIELLELRKSGIHVAEY